MVADHNPAEIQRIKDCCTATEVAKAWKSRQARAYGVGYTAVE